MECSLMAIIHYQEILWPIHRLLQYLLKREHKPEIINIYWVKVAVSEGDVAQRNNSVALWVWQ